MFELIRTHKRWVMVLLLVLIIPSFILFGVRSWYQEDSAQKVAKIGKQSITLQELDFAVRNQLERIRQMFGSQFDLSQIDQNTMRVSVLNHLIQQHILSNQAKDQNITILDEEVRAVLLSIPAIAALKKPDGSFDTKAYAEFLETQGTTPTQLDQQLRTDLAAQQLVNNISQSSWVPKTTLNHLIALSTEKREIQTLRFDTKQYLNKINPTAEAVKTYYQQHTDQFKTPEKAAIEYLVLDPAAITVKTPDEAALQAEYQRTLENYKNKEERQVSHILISDADPKKAKAKAETILKQVQQHPEQFSDIAKKESQDPGSAANGGDLGYFARGVMVKPFEDSAFSLQKNEMSALVKTDFGYHIIKVTDIKPETTQGFDKVKENIKSNLMQQQKIAFYQEQADKMTQALNQAPQTLSNLAQTLKLPLKTAEVINHNAEDADPESKSPLSNQKFLDTLFSPDTLANKKIIGPIDIPLENQEEPSLLLVARIIRHNPEKTLEFAQAENKARELLTLKQAQALAKKEGEQKLALLKNNNKAEPEKKELKAFSAASVLSRYAQTDAHMPSQAIDAIFSIAASTLPQYIGVDLAEGYTLYRINKVLPHEKNESEENLLTQRINEVQTHSEINAYLNTLRAQAEVKIFPSVYSGGDASDAQKK